MKLVLRILQWAALLPVHILIIIARYPLAPIAILLFSSKDKRTLVLLRWLETLDNDLGGDSGWRNEHIKPGSNPLSFWNRTRWLWRNGGNSANYNLLGCAADMDWIAGHIVDASFYSRPDGYWCLYAFYKLPFTGKYLNLFWGWGLHGPKHSRCKFTFTTRIKATNY